METLPLDTLIAQTKRYPRPETDDETDALLELLRPDFNHIARNLVSNPDNFAASCHQVLEGFGAPDSPFFHETIGVRYDVKHAICQAIKRQPETTELLFHEACHVFSGLPPQAVRRPKSP